MKRPVSRSAAAWRRAMLALDETPEPHWLSRTVHHGGRVLLLLATAVAVFLLFPAPRVPDAAVLERGVVAPGDVIAEFPFNILKDPNLLLQEQAEAASGVPPVYERSPAAQDSLLAGVRALFASLDSIASHVPAEAQPAAVRALMERSRLSPTPNSVGILLSASRRRTLQRSIESAVRDLYPRGVVPSTLDPSVSAIRVRSPAGEERLVPRDSLLTPEHLFRTAAERLPSWEGAEAAELQRLVLIRLFQPSLRYDEESTEAARARARAVVDPVKATVLKGEKVVGAHEQVGEREEERLRAYQNELTRRGMLEEARENSVARSVGAVLYNALVLSIFGALLLLFHRPLYRDWRSVLVLALLALTVMAAGSLVARLDLPADLIPVTFAALIVAVLWGGRLALTLSLALALLIGGQSPFLGMTAPFAAAVGGAAAAFSMRVVQRRSKTWLFISIISLAYVASAVTMGLLRSLSPSEVLWAAGWGVANAIVASLLAIGFLPLLEAFTRVTTDQTLLELSDLNRSLLKRLSLEAPGTYAHTINVANLTEAAARAIGANGLLARVGTYYHDIGKLVKPQYFIENQPKGRNPHDKLKPSMSSSIIRSHVLEGLKLAEAEKLPEVIKSFIAEHHGTQPITYFYNRAREMDPEAQLNPSDFSYPGPKPQTKETAILMLADSVESATRVLQDPTPTRIKELVDRIVAGKMAEGQLDQSPITLRELDTVKGHLTKVLTGMYHHRIDYPTAPPPAPVPEEETIAAGEAPVPQR